MALHVGPAGEPDKYELSEVRSRGGEGEVWKGTLRVDSVQVPVAIKLILPSNEAEIDAWTERWGRQAELLRSLKHSGLVTVREVFLGPGPHLVGEADPSTTTLCLVMNWVEGPTLVEWVSRNPERHALESMQVIGGLASAVDYLHSGAATGQPILHRDIKPANVILADSGPQLVDFGFVRAAQSGAPLTMVGTPAYVAPEVATGLDYSAASDRYALGATAYFALTGEAPAIDDIEAMRSRLNSVKGLEGRADLQDHILSMVSRDPNRRPTSAVDWAQSLAAMSVVGGFTQVSTQATQSMPASEQPVAAGPQQKTFLQRYGVVVGIAAVVLIAILVVAGMLAGGDSEPAAAAPGEATTVTEASDTDSGDGPSTTAAEQDTQGVVLVPSVVGLSESEAIEALGAAGIVDYSIETMGDAAPEGTVLSVEPSPGTEIVSGVAVVLTVAAPLMVEVPELVGETAGDATAALAELGMYDIETQRVKSVKPTDSVIQVLPPPGSEVSLDTQILLTVADPLETPDFLALSLDEATAQAEALGATVRVDEVYSPDIEPGTLFGQDPAAGQQMTETLVLQVGEAPGSLLLEDLGWLERRNSAWGQGDIDGETFIHALRLADDHWEPPAWAEFNLSKDFDVLAFTGGYDDVEDAGGVVRLEVFLDGTQVYTRDYRLGSGQDVAAIAVTGGLRLRIVATQIEGGQDDSIVLGEIELLGDPVIVSKYYD